MSYTELIKDMALEILKENMSIQDALKYCNNEYQAIVGDAEMEEIKDFWLQVATAAWVSNGVDVD